ncbi:MAG: hypothetical protein IKW00_05240 [Clostridia bacterium]|nr:hypothetical protein [Clostridia bacterium]
MTVSENRIFDLSMIWKQASALFPYFDKLDMNWDQVYLKYLSKLSDSLSEMEFHLLLAEFTNQLCDGHTDYSLPRSLRSSHGFFPFSLRLVENRYYIDTAPRAYEELLYQPILAINHMPIEQLITQLFRYCYHVDTYIPGYRLHHFLPFLLNPAGNILSTEKGEYAFDLLPEIPRELQAAEISLPRGFLLLKQNKLDIRLYDESILYVRIDDFLYREAADEIRAALQNANGIKGLIVDVRENIGGMTIYGAEVAKLLISGEFQACSKRTRLTKGVDFASASQLSRWSEERINKHITDGYSTREEMEESLQYIKNAHFFHYQDRFGSPNHTALFNGPCVLLSSRHTLSAAEDFTAMFKTNKRAVIIGAPTSGTTGTPLIQQLSCGGMLRVCSVGYRLLDGTEFIGRGIEPDIPCELTLDDYRKGYDSVLEKGLSHLKTLL